MTTHARGDGREPLTREKIIEKALELLDAEGVEGFSMRRLGEALGVEAMALYHHFPSKGNEILPRRRRPWTVEETALALPRADAASDWKAVLLSGPAAAARAMVAHPKAGWLFLGRQSSAPPHRSKTVETPLEVLHTAGFRGQELVERGARVLRVRRRVVLPRVWAGGLLEWAQRRSHRRSGRGGASGARAPVRAPRGLEPGMEQGLLALLEGLEARLEK